MAANKIGEFGTRAMGRFRKRVAWLRDEWERTKRRLSGESAPEEDAVESNAFESPFQHNTMGLGVDAQSKNEVSLQDLRRSASRALEEEARRARQQRRSNRRRQGRARRKGRGAGEVTPTKKDG